MLCWGTIDWLRPELGKTLGETIFFCEERNAKRSISGLWVSEWQLSCGQIHSPWLGDIVDSGIRLSYRPASLCSLAGRQLFPPVRDYEFGYRLRDLRSHHSHTVLSPGAPPPPTPLPQGWWGRSSYKEDQILYCTINSAWPEVELRFCPWPLLFKYEQVWALPSINEWAFSDQLAVSRLCWDTPRKIWLMRGGRPKARLTLMDLRFKYTCIKQPKQPPQVNVFFCLGLVH